MEHKQSGALERAMDLVRFLRTHCPWDAAQTPRSLIPYLLEEAHESADAIAEEDDPALQSELGDLLLNLAFQIVLAEERRAFGADAVADTVIAKMQRRHPHLYGLGEKEDWESLKARERDPDASILHGVARGLDPLSKAHRIQDRVAAVGFDWEDTTGAFQKVAEELEEVRQAMKPLRTAEAAAPPDPANEAAAEERERTGGSQSVARGSTDGGGREPAGRVQSGGREPTAAEVALEEELGDLLFAVVNLTRLAGAHALNALHGANAKFTRRFTALERRAAERGIVLEEAGLEALDRLWNEIKLEEP